MKIQPFRKILSNQGQSAIEYLLLFALVVVVVVYAFRPGGLFDGNITDSIDVAIDTFTCTAETACFDPDCTPVCGNGCCEVNEGSGELFECVDDCDCTPESEADTCSNIECGVASNNCGQSVTCATCTDSLVCVNNSCVCKDDDSSITCEGVYCGSRINNCGNPVDCGACCVPDPDPCASVPCGSTTDGCGAPVDCPDTCVLPYTCNEGTNSCNCTDAPSPCGEGICGTQIDACGNEVDCPDAPSPCGVDLCGTQIDACGKEIDCPDACTGLDSCDLVTNTCVCVDPEPCGVGKCNEQEDICGNIVDCGPLCGCFEPISGWNGGRCPNGDEQTCPAGVLGEKVSCEAPGEACLNCDAEGNGIWYRCDYFCDDWESDGCAPNMGLFEYPCSAPRYTVYNYKFLCGTPNDTCGTPMLEQQCGQPCSEGFSCVFADASHSSCVADDCSAGTDGADGSRCTYPSTNNGDSVSGACDEDGLCSVSCSGGAATVVNACVPTPKVWCLTFSENCGDSLGRPCNSSDDTCPGTADPQGEACTGVSCKYWSGGSSISEYDCRSAC